MELRKKVQITEYLEIDLERELWCCNRCGLELGPARENYKKYCLLYERDPREIHNPHLKIAEGNLFQQTFSPHPDWCRIIEFYCPGCGTMLEVEYLPPGYPLTHDIELDLDTLKKYFVGNVMNDKDFAFVGGKNEKGSF